MPRAAALDLLHAVLGRKRPLEEALEHEPSYLGLSTRDRALARNLVSTVIRRLGQIDAAVDHCLVSPLRGKARAARDVLRLGAVQVLFLDIPDHAAVDTAVALAETRGLGPYKRLVNAVLRRLAREGPALLAAQDAPRLNTPAWLWASWVEAYGEAATRAIAEAHLVAAPLDITCKVAPESWAERLGGRLLRTGTVRLEDPGPVAELQGFADGAWWVQDAAAALPVRLLGDVAGKTVIEIGAAPGGKTAQLAACGARVIAVERSPARAERLSANLKRLGLSAEIVVADAEAWRPSEPADAVLVDAPCTATGTLRRHPDVAWLKTQGDVRALADMQGRLLAAAAAMARPAGTVVFCTCSLQPEEGLGVLEHSGEVGRSLFLKPVDPAAAGLAPEWLGTGGVLRTFPFHLLDHGGMDGFFAARLVRGEDRQR